MRWFQILSGAAYEILLVIAAAISTLAGFEQPSAGAILTGVVFGLILLAAAAGVSLSGYGFSGHFLRMQGVQLPAVLKKGIAIFHGVLATLLGVMTILVLNGGCGSEGDPRAWMNGVMPFLFLLSLLFLVNLWMARGSENAVQENQE